MDVRFINPFIDACRRLFKEHLGLSIQIGKAYLGDGGRQERSAAVVIVTVDLSGSAAGRVKLRLGEPTALALMTAFTGQETKSLDAKTLDGMREIANILVGSAKRSFPGELTKMSTPIAAKSDDADWQSDRRVLVVPVSTPAGPMWIEAKLSVSPGVPAAEADAADKRFEAPAVDEQQVQDMVDRLLRAD